MTSQARRAAAASANRLLAAMAVVSVGAVAVALVSQHVFAMQPCPWCVLQRAILVAIALACGLGLAWRGVVRNGSVGCRAAASLALGLALCGVGASLWQHFKAAASQACSLTLADKIVSGTLHLDRLAPGVFEARASCADAAVNLFGVPYDFWSLGLFLLLAAAALGVAARPA